jgi:hypothetical protein
MKAYGGVDVQIHFSIFTSTLVRVSGQLHAHAALSSEKKPRVPIGRNAGCTSGPFWTIWRSVNS